MDLGTVAMFAAVEASSMNPLCSDGFCSICALRLRVVVLLW
jgi:hypothetical protein